MYHSAGTGVAEWENVSSAPGTVPNATPIGDSANGIGERWVACTHQILFQGNAAPDSNGHVYQQVFWYNIDTNVTQQLTTSAHAKHAGFMFKAPEFNNNFVFFTVSDRLEIDIYQQTGTTAAGAPKFAVVNQIRSPDASEPYINSTEPFINCSPTCKTYIFMTLSSTADSQNGDTVPNGLAVTNIDPAHPKFKILVPAAAKPTRQRLDPEYFITAKGPYLYYQRIITATSKHRAKNEGEYYLDMQLGPPTGTTTTSQ
jgi:hypothetical protein